MDLALAQVDLGDVPTWATAFVAAVAAVAAIVAGRYAVKTYDTTRRQLEEDHRSNLVQQKLLEQQLADQLATNEAQRTALAADRIDRANDREQRAIEDDRRARSQAEQVTVGRTSVPSYDSASRSVAVAVHNDGPLPIRNVTVRAMAGIFPSKPSMMKQFIRAFDESELRTAFDTDQVLDPEHFRYLVEFIDAAGTGWMVTSEGRLRSRRNERDSWTERRPAPGDSETYS